MKSGVNEGRKIYCCANFINSFNDKCRFQFWIPTADDHNKNTPNSMSSNNMSSNVTHNEYPFHQTNSTYPHLAFPVGAYSNSQYATFLNDDNCLTSTSSSSNNSSSMTRPISGGSIPSRLPSSGLNRSVIMSDYNHLSDDYDYDYDYAHTDTVHHNTSSSSSCGTSDKINIS